VVCRWGGGGYVDKTEEIHLDAKEGTYNVCGGNT